MGDPFPVAAVRAPAPAAGLPGRGRAPRQSRILFIGPLYNPFTYFIDKYHKLSFYISGIVVESMGIPINLCE